MFCTTAQYNTGNTHATMVRHHNTQRPWTMSWPVLPRSALLRKTPQRTHRPQWSPEFWCTHQIDQLMHFLTHHPAVQCRQTHSVDEWRGSPFSPRQPRVKHRTWTLHLLFSTCLFTQPADLCVKNEAVNPTTPGPVIKPPHLFHSWTC